MSQYFKMATTLLFGNWQRFLDEQTKEASLVEDIIVSRSAKDVFMKVLQHDKLSSCHWISDYFQGVQNIKRTGFKNDRAANTFRCKGNLSFKKKDYTAALEEYNNAILRATHSVDDGTHTGVSELALSYGNRSAVYLHLSKYELCLSDIQAALTSGYPSCLQCKLLSRQAQCLVRLGRTRAAEEAVTEAERCVGEVEAAKQESAAEDIRRVRAEIEKMGGDVMDSSTPDVSPTPFRGHHSIVTQASAALDLKCTEDQGRHLVANCDIPAGEVLIVEKPYASVLLPDFYTCHCHRCYVALTHFYPCRFCPRARFCSPLCEEEAWSAYHSVECPYQDLLHSVGIAHLSLRVILTAGLSYLTGFQSEMEKVSLEDGAVGGIPGVTAEGRYESNYLSVYSLMTHTDSMQPEDLTQYALTAHLLLRVLEHSGYFESPSADESHMSTDSPAAEGSLPETMEQLSLSQPAGHSKAVRSYIGSLLLRHICQLVCNGHAITEVQLTQGKISELVDTQSQERIATAIYPTTSLLNHSCQPTIINSFIKNQLVVRAIKPVKSGEQIYNCYGPHCGRMEYADRQATLKSQYFFTCQCSACVDQGKLEALYTALRCLKCEGPVPMSGEFAGTCLDCQAALNTQDIRPLVRQDEQAFLRAVRLLDKGDYKGCLKLLLTTLKSQLKTLYRYNRNVSQTQDAVAKCYATTGEYSKAVLYLREAMIITELIYGKESIESGYELQKYAELLLRAGQKEACFQATERAIAIFKMHYGQEHAALEDLTKLLAMAKYA